MGRWEGVKGRNKWVWVQVSDKCLNIITYESSQNVKLPSRSRHLIHHVLLKLVFQQLIIINNNPQPPIYNPNFYYLLPYHSLHSLPYIQLKYLTE